LVPERNCAAYPRKTDWHNPSLLPLDPNDEHIVEYECDGPTRIKEIRYRRKKDPSFKKTVWAYHDGIKTERADYFADGTFEKSEKYGYDEKGNLIEEIFKQQVHPEHFSPKKHDVYITTKRTFGYDGQSNRTSETHYRPDGSLYAIWMFKYDSRNRLVKDTRKDNLGRLQDQYFYKYDSHNRLVEEKHYANFCITRNNEFCKGTLNSGDGVFYYLTKITYEYDRRGNWVKQRHFAMGGQSGSQVYQPVHMLIRRIIYYK
jgi:hypothetical protein